MSKTENTAVKKLEERKTMLRILWGKIRQVDRDQLDLDKVFFLRKNPFFETLTKSQLEQVAKLIYERDYLANEFVFEVGQPGAALFIVQSGEISIEVPSLEEQPTYIATISKASFFGELALLNDDPRSASARAVIPSRVLALFHKDLNKLSEKYPEITSKIYQALAVVVGRRLKATNEFIDKKLRAVA